MKPGDTVLTKNLVAWSPQAQATYKPPKGEVFVVLVLGSTLPEPEEPFDANEALRRMGWEMTEEPSDG